MFRLRLATLVAPAQRYCPEAVPAPAALPCEIVPSFDGHEPWLDTQDLRIFEDGARTALRPIRITAWFDGEDSGARTADHDAYIVTYAIARVAAEVGVRADRPGGSGHKLNPVR